MANTTQSSNPDVLNQPESPSARVLAFSTLGYGSNEEARIRDLLRDVGAELFPFDRAHKVRMFRWLLLKMWRIRPDLVVMEGTGVAGGAALILARAMFGQRYLVSSGDAVGPWVGSRFRLLGPVFGLYERVLCRVAAGFIGWTPYLVGRALTFGTPRDDRGGVGALPPDPGGTDRRAATSSLRLGHSGQRTRDRDSRFDGLDSALPVLLRDRVAEGPCPRPTD